MSYCTVWMKQALKYTFEITIFKLANFYKINCVALVYLTLYLNFS